MNKLTASDLVNIIAQLDMNQVYEYVSGRTRTKLVEVIQPEGPITFKRWESNQRETEATQARITKPMLAKAALAFSNRPNYPIHFDRLFSAGGNSRSALETLLVHTSHFFICYPERTDVYTGEVIKNLKHIMWRPGDEHTLGEIGRLDYDELITEFELGVAFDDIKIPQQSLTNEFEGIEAKRTHTQMQVALIEIGNALNFRTWIARNDRSIEVGGSKLGEFPGVIRSLGEIPILYTSEIKEAASLIDCIWFTQNFDRIPAIIEIEHSTGVISGLVRMQKLHSLAPALSTTFTIVAPNELRNKVVNEANQNVFRVLNTNYMPYSTVRELYGLIRRYSLTDVVDHTFIKPFMENIVSN